MSLCGRQCRCWSVADQACTCVTTERHQAVQCQEINTGLLLTCFYVTYNLDVLLRWPSVPDFPGPSWFLITCPGKDHSSPGMAICSIFDLVSQICPNIDKLRYSTVWILILNLLEPESGGQNLAQILSVYTKESLAARALPRSLLWSSRHSPDPKLDPDVSCLRRLPPTTRAFGAYPGLRCLDYGHLMYYARCSHQGTRRTISTK